MFIGRESELSFLESRYSSNNAEFIIIYGRRRVGKTETVKEFCKGKEHIFYSCSECTDKEQLKLSSTRMLESEIPAKKYINEFSDWSAAFSI